MANGQITEKEFLKTKFKDIINVNNILEGIVEYAVADNYISDTITIYRFRDNKNIGTFEIDIDELDDDIPNKLMLKTVNFISTTSSIILYSLLLANIEMVSSMNLELVVPLIMLHLFTIVKSSIYSFTGYTNIKKAIETNIIEAIGLIPLVTLLSIIAFKKQNYLMIGLHLLLAFLIFIRNLINIARCTNVNDL